MQIEEETQHYVQIQREFQLFIKENLINANFK